MSLDDNPFAWRVSKDGQVRVTRGGRVVIVLRGATAARLIGKLADAEEDEAQHLLARATGNYKRGNERNT